MDKNRKIEFDILKGISILLVIIGHARPIFPVYEFFYSFHVPLFFVVSGYFFTLKDNIGRVVLKNAKQLLKPYVVVAVIVSILYYIFKNNSTTIIIKELLLGSYVANDNSISIGPLWFFLALFICRITYRIIYNGIESLLTRSVVVLIIAILFVSLQKNALFDFPFQISQGMVGLFYYHSGCSFALVTAKNNVRLERKYIIVALFSLLTCACCISFYHSNSTAMNLATVSFPLFPIDFLNSLLLCFSLYILVLFFVTRRKCIKLIDFLSWIGANSIVIYCIHCIEYHFTIDPIAVFVDERFASGNVVLYSIMRLINPFVQVVICVFGLYLYKEMKGYISRCHEN